MANARTRLRFNNRPNGGFNESFQVAANQTAQAKGQETSQESRQAGEEAEAEKREVGRPFRTAKRGA
jgi:hypothetical protein